MDYDVFLSFSSDDHSPSGLDVLNRLEAAGYRVCYHLRDFVAGLTIEANVVQAVQSSKRTICLLTRNFIQRSTHVRKELVVPPEF